MSSTGTVAGWDWGAPASRRAPETPARRRAPSPLIQLLRYVAAHRKYAALTVLFGVTGFLLSFVYPWIIGSAVDLVTVPAIQHLPLAARASRLVHLTELAAVTGVMHALVLYGRGHFNVHLGDGIVTDLRRELY